MDNVRLRKKSYRIFHDGENTIVLDFLTPTRADGKKDWVAPDMIAIEPLKPKTGLVIILK